ncbi:MAG TPA: hypothetical protein VF274_05230 [Alphaproteobacteria bacterium]
MADGDSQDIVRTGGAGDARGGRRVQGRLPKPYRFRRFWIAFAHALLTAFGLAALALAAAAAALSFVG